MKRPKDQTHIESVRLADCITGSMLDVATLNWQMVREANSYFNKPRFINWPVLHRGALLRGISVSKFSLSMIIYSNFGSGDIFWYLQAS